MDRALYVQARESALQENPDRQEVAPKQRYARSATWRGQSRSVIALLTPPLELGVGAGAVVAAHTRRSAPGKDKARRNGACGRRWVSVARTKKGTFLAEVRP